MALDVYSLHLMYTFIYSFYKMLKYFVYHKCVFCNITLSRQTVTSVRLWLLSCFIQDMQVSELAQDLANKLGLKIRKAYVSPQVCSPFSI